MGHGSGWARQGTEMFRKRNSVFCLSFNNRRKCTDRGIVFTGTVLMLTIFPSVSGSGDFLVSSVLAAPTVAVSLVVFLNFDVH